VKRIGVLLVLLATWPAFGADDALLSNIAAGLGRSAVLRAEFTQTKKVAALTRPLESSGRLVYARERGIVWKIERPYRVTYLLNDAGVVELDASGAVSSSAGQGPGWQHVSRIFRSLFAADLTALDQYFVAAARGEPAHWEIVLDPRPALKPIFQNVVVKGGRFVEQVNFAESNGDTMTIRFVNIREAATLDTNEFDARRRE